MSANTTPAVGYSRVSTREQGRSGLRLAAQCCEIEAFGAREGLSVESWDQDVRGGGRRATVAPGTCGSLEAGRVGALSANRLQARPSFEEFDRACGAWVEVDRHPRLPMSEQNTDDCPIANEGVLCGTIGTQCRLQDDACCLPLRCSSCRRPT
jgi:hypothetical protein